MTDRRYINWWLACAESGLVEGRDYQVMFYGGALLSKVAATDEPSDEDIGEFVQLLSLGRRLIVVMDSESNSRDDRTNDVMDRGKTKHRIRGEVEGAGGLAWITNGRQIENYLAPEVATRAYLESNGAERNVDFGNTFARLPTDFNTVRVARTVELLPPSADHLGPLDLRERINEVVAYIRESQRV